LCDRICQKVIQKSLSAICEEWYLSARVKHRACSRTGENACTFNVQELDEVSYRTCRSRGVTGINAGGTGPYAALPAPVAAVNPGS
jgi:hypothetical protein